MTTTEIKKCRICDNNDLVTILDLGDHALSCRFPGPNEDEPPTEPLVLVKCNDSQNTESCGLLQLKHNVASNELYFHNYGYRSGLNKTMTNHLANLVAEIENKVTLKKTDIVLDIGSNDATLLKSYSKNVNRIGIDPTGTQFKRFYTSDIQLVPDFFTESNFKKIFPTKKAKVVTSISMFYDLPDPVQFMTDIKEILDPNGIWVTEQSYMVTMLERNSIDTICHEHLEYYSFKQLEWMAKKVGLKIIDVTLNECNGGSFRTTFAHMDSSYQINEHNIKVMKNKEFDMQIHTLVPYQDFQVRCEKLKFQLVNFLKEQKESGKSIYIYGASTKGNTLLQYYGIDNNTITAAAERNTEKFGRRTPKTNIPIISEAAMREINPDFLLVLPWHFKEEFLERESAYLLTGGQYIFPLPCVNVISKKKTALITGINGQIGTYLTDLLLEKDYIVYGIVRDLQQVKSVKKNVFYHQADLLEDTSCLDDFIISIKPDEIYNLAAQTDATVSVRTPMETLQLNGVFVMKLCELIKKINLPIKLFQANSSELFKGSRSQIINENDIHFHPKNPYALGKLLAYWTTRWYRETYGMFCVNGMIFTTESPLRKSSFVFRKI